ncbi:hypothetical protein HDU83_008240 [Entophlyctis luteolus]|nr:hypothetical protein HDU83_008240 [Entophlyctis luteolus]
MIANQLSLALVALCVLAKTLATSLFSLLPRPLRETLITLSTAVLVGPISFFDSAVDTVQTAIAFVLGAFRQVHADAVRLHAFITAALQNVNNIVREFLCLLANILELLRLCLFGACLHWIVVFLRVLVPQEQENALKNGGIQVHSGELREADVQHATTVETSGVDSIETATHKPESDMSIDTSGTTTEGGASTSGSSLADADEAAGCEDEFGVIPESDDEASVNNSEKDEIIRILQERVSELEADSRNAHAELEVSNAKCQFLGTHVRCLEAAASVRWKAKGTILRSLNRSRNGNDELYSRLNLIYRGLAAELREEILEAEESRREKLAQGCNVCNVAPDAAKLIEAARVLGKFGCAELGVPVTLSSLFCWDLDGTGGRWPAGYVDHFVRVAKLEHDWEMLRAVLECFQDEGCAQAGIDLSWAMLAKLGADWL